MLFRETSPAPLKYALSLLGLMSPKVRLPLVIPSEKTRSEVATVMAQMCDVHAESMIGSMAGLRRRYQRAAVA